MPSFARFARPRVSRHARHRVMGLVLLALFARQPMALGGNACSEAGSTPVLAHGGGTDDMTGMTGMTHGHDDAGGDTPPAPDRDSGCDHSIPAGDCGVGIGCVVAMLGTAVVITVTRTTPTAAVRLPTPVRPCSLEFAPDPPPPRA